MASSAADNRGYSEDSAMSGTPLSNSIDVPANDSMVNLPAKPPIEVNQSKRRPVIVGIYGIQGCGKTYLMNQLKEMLGEGEWAYYDGSGMIDKVTKGGLDAFKRSSEKEKEGARRAAIEAIAEECADAGKVGIVTGHYVLEHGDCEPAEIVWTSSDAATFTHVIYMQVPPEVINERRRADEKRSRFVTSFDLLEGYQNCELRDLPLLCAKHGILFSVISFPVDVSRVKNMLLDFKAHGEEYNISLAKEALDEVVADNGRDRLETMLVLDADRTLCAMDTGKRFWKESKTDVAASDPLKALFSGPLKYTYTAFRQAVLLSEKCLDDTKYLELCRTVAKDVAIHPEFVSLLECVRDARHVGAVIITCGYRRIWEEILLLHKLDGVVKVIGGGRINDRYVVTAEVKETLAKRLKEKHGLYVWAFGDSVLDLPMLKQVHQAVVVVGHKHERSSTMDEELRKAIDNGRLLARQALLPSFVTPRLDVGKLPLIHMAEAGTMNSILQRRTRKPLLFRHATSKSAGKLLQTPMRDAINTGPVLRESHRRVGWYLAIEYVADLLGLEEIPIMHVQPGRDAVGHRLLHENRITIVALMRGGEPMALGVSEAFPSSMFVHASCPSDLKAHHVSGRAAIILVDSVVNSGNTVVEFVNRVRILDREIRIVVVAGVVQMGALGGVLEGLDCHVGLGCVALRVSENRYTGVGGTDTGNRLFGTMMLE